MLYLICILLSMALIMVFNIFVAIPIFQFTYTDVIFATIISTVSVIVIDLIFAFIVRRMLPAKWFSWDKNYFDGSKKLCQFYEKLGIKKWKDKVLELGALSSFRKNKIAEPTNNTYIERYIMEANFGVLVHIFCMIFGFSVIFIYPVKIWWCFGLPVAIVNFILNLLPYMILKYNLPKLRVVHKFNERRNKKSENIKAEIN